MISVKTLQAYPFFARLSQTQIEALIPFVMEEHIPYGGTFFEEGQSAQYLFLLTRGSVDLYFKMPDDPRHRVLAGEINAIEPFGISALIEPHLYAMTARAATDCHILRIDGQSLRALMERDPQLGYTLMGEIAKASMERMHLAQQRLAEEEQPELVI
ncbi:MAG: cyclic nucleotide-binding domain-containing protein [Chloroflexota bacterium]|nr:MAG: cyclic nucleotide-binding domain-containing protein [Chloroflexota bacterium]